MLRSIEAALKSCQTSHGVVDLFHRAIWEDLQRERERLKRLIKGSQPTQSVQRESTPIEVE